MPRCGCLWKSAVRSASSASTAPGSRGESTAAPAEKPKYAFAALYESEVGSRAHGGSAAAPMIGRILRQIYGEKNGSEQKQRAEPEESDDTSD